VGSRTVIPQTGLRSPRFPAALAALGARSLAAVLAGPAARADRVYRWAAEPDITETWRVTARSMSSRTQIPEVAVRVAWVVIVVWLLIGAAAAGQRNYYTSSSVNCSGMGTIAVTILFGPVNYLGADPKLTCH
jgi:hypothetical protein